MFECPKCRQSNLDDAQFCSRCHRTLLYHCPKCWHNQRTAAKCEKCGEDLTLYWTRRMTLARADMVRERAEKGPDLRPDPPPPPIEDIHDLVASVPNKPIPFLKFAALMYLRLASWFGFAGPL
jgi:hypothetical protein